MITNWLVIGYDQFEDQAFWDVIPADDESQARTRFKSVRQDYAVIVDTMPVSELISMAARFQVSTAQAESEFAEIRSGHETDQVSQGSFPRWL